MACPCFYGFFFHSCFMVTATSFRVAEVPSIDVEVVRKLPNVIAI